MSQPLIILYLDVIIYSVILYPETKKNKMFRKI